MITSKDALDNTTPTNCMRSALRVYPVLPVPKPDRPAVVREYDDSLFRVRIDVG